LKAEKRLEMRTMVSAKMGVRKGEVSVMIYYRLASPKRYSTEWEWKSSAVGSLEALFRLSQRYRTIIPAERLRVFLASSVPFLDLLLVRENKGLLSNSLTLDQVLHHNCGLTTPQIRRFEMELGWGEETAHAVTHQAVPVVEQKSRKERVLPVLSAVDHELGGGDHDVPYTFAFPQVLPQVLAWMRLRERVLASGYCQLIYKNEI
jgi:hypothetical protein